MWRCLLPIVVAALATAACQDGANDGGAACVTDRDCRGGAGCAPPGTVSCGAPGRCESECAADGDCFPPYRPLCGVPRAAPCCAAKVRTCVARCDGPGASCPAGERCGARGCEPLPCDAGWRCADDLECRLADPGADGHGCARRACGSDDDCGAGVCVGGLCWSGPWSCQGPFA